MAVGDAAHIAVDVRLASSAGHRTFVRNLLPRMARLAPTWRWSVIGDSKSLHQESWVAACGARVVHCDARVYGIREQLEVPFRVPGDADLLWATHYNVPLLLRTPLVATVHDVAHLRLPEYTTSKLRRTYSRVMFAGLVAKARAVMCISEFSRRELAAVAPASANRAVVVPLGVDDTWYGPETAASPVETPYFVFVGNLKPHKNVGVLLDAMRRVGESVRERLVIVGNSDLRTPDRAVLESVRSLGERVVLTGPLPDAELRAVVRCATALVMPSLYEGFGLPPLEAMAAGCPVISSRSGSLPEVCGEAALSFDARDAAELARILERVSSSESLRANLTRLGREQARKFSWEESAAAALAVLRGALTSGPHRGVTASDRVTLRTSTVRNG